MDFSEADEWRSLFVREKAAHHRETSPRGWRCSLEQSHGGCDRLYTVEELGGKHCTVRELLDMSPEGSEKDWPVEWATEGGSEEFPTTHQLEDFRDDMSIDSRCLQHSSYRETAIDVHARSETCSRMDSQASQQLLIAQRSSSSIQRPEAINRVPSEKPFPPLEFSPESPKASSSRPRKQFDPPARRENDSLFVRRLPEEYVQLESAESSLTTKLRWQSNFDFPGFALMASASIAQKIEVNVRLPPHDRRREKGSVVSMSVNATMRVEELLRAVVNQHSSRLGNSANSSKYELRLYDEDEEEPDYDFPPLDKGSEVSALNVTDIALCEIQLTNNTPPSPPLSSPSEQLCELGERDVTPEAIGNLLREAETAGKNDIPRHVLTMCSTNDALKDAMLQEDPSATEYACDPPQWRLGEVPATRPLRKGSDSEVVARTVSGQTAEALGTGKRSHRRCRSSPIHSVVVVGGFEQLEAPSGLTRRHGSAMNLTAYAGHFGGTQSRQLTISLADGAAPCTLHAPPATSTTSLNGSAHSSEAETANSEVPPSSSTAGAYTSKKGDENHVPESIVLTIRDDATLLEVLEQVATKFRQEQFGNRTYDPVNFAFERIDDGITQRLDLDMQVKQLPLHSSSLTLVRKDAPLVFMPVAQKNHRRLEAFALSRGPSEFIEYGASIPCEYLVTVAIRGSKTRPRECQLIIDAERLYHQPVRGSPDPDGHKKRHFMSTLTKKLVKPWADGSRAETSIFVERRICDVQKVSGDLSSNLGLCIVYGNDTECGAVELVYEAQTPADRDDLVDRVQSYSRYSQRH